MAEYLDVLKSVIDKKEISIEDIDKHFVGFAAIKWLSANPLACYTANIINSARGNKYIPKVAEYKFLRESIKLPKNTYIPFDKKDKDMKVLLEYLVLEFKTKPSVIKEYFKILGGKKILEILNKYAQWDNTHTTDPRILDLRKSIKAKEKELLSIKGVE